MSTTQYIHYPNLGGSGGVTIYPTLADFPATAPTGTLAVAADSGILYEFFGGSWMAVAAPGDVLSLGAFGSTPNADGLSIAANVLNMQPASVTYPGGISTTTQTFAGLKTFNSLLTLNAGVTSSYTTGNRNEAFGLGAGSSITSGTDNTFLGYDAGTLLTTDSGTTGIGSGALASLTNNSSVGNTAVGYQAMTALTTSAGYNTALGYQAGAALTTGFQNTVFGYQSLNASLQAELVCAIGQGAFTNCINISNAVGVGASAGFGCTSSYVTYLGAQAGQDAGGNFSTAIGYQSLMSSTGLSSVGLGIFAGINSSGSNTLYIGDTTQDPSAYAINTVVIASSNATGANWTQKANFSNTINMSALTASTALALDSSKNIVSSSTTATELGYVHGVTSAIQTQLNALQPSGNYITALTGDATASGPGSVALTLATVNSNTGSFGSSTSIPSFTVNGKGLITAASSNVVVAPAGTLSGTVLNSTVVTSSLTSLGVQSQALNMGSFNINALLDPTTAQQAATKNYVDTVASQLNPLQAVTAASTTNIPGTYVQVGGGIGDTFTTTSTATFTVDGVTPTLGQRILFKNQTSGQQNGVYNITTLANVGVLGAIFTRSLDYDTVSDINAGDLIPVINGTANANTSWLQTATVTTVGSSGTPLVFAQWTANPANYLLKANNLSDVASASTSFNNISPMTTGGDLIYGGASGAGTRLANGSAGQVLTSNGTTLAPSWQTSSGGTPSYVRLDGFTQFGSTNTVIVDLTTITTTSGSGLTAANSTTNGSSITVNTAGVYTVTIFGNCNSVGTIGASVNSNQLTTPIYAITETNILISATCGGAGYSNSGAFTGYFNVNDIVRMHGDGTAGTLANISMAGPL